MRAPRLRAALAALTVALGSSGAQAQPFPFMITGFTQEVYGVGDGIETFGGVAFAPDNDVWVDFCRFSGSRLERFDRQSTVVMSGTTIHPPVSGSPFASNAGCGLTNHRNGSMYANTAIGVVRLDASTAAQLGGPAGPPGGFSRGITPDPRSDSLVYVASDGTICTIDAALTGSRVFSTATTGNFVAGIYFDTSGEFLFCANRSPTYRLTVLGRSGQVVQHVTMTSEPVGIAFRSLPPRFVVTNNIDGTLKRFDFPGNDFTQPPLQTTFAQHGFRGNLSQVGRDRCLYVTQDFTRWDDGSITIRDCLVRICGGFSLSFSDIDIAPRSDTNLVNTFHTVTATVTPNGAPLPGRLVTFAVIAGPNTGVSGVCTVNPGCTTGANGQVSWTYASGGNVGIDVIRASFIDDAGFEQEARATKEWMSPTSTELALASAHARPDMVSLTWHGAGVAEPYRVQRRQHTSDWEVLATVRSDASGTIVHEDRAVRAGESYGYRLAFDEEGAESYGGESWIEVPGGAELALLGARPNPTRRGLVVWFSLPDGQSARLDLLDVAGRRLQSHDVGSRGAGLHALDLSRGVRTSPGIYLIRLTRGERILSSRAIVTR